MIGEVPGEAPGLVYIENWQPFHQVPRATLMCRETGRQITVEDLL